MEDELICLDTSVLIDYYRKTKKENSFFYQLTEKYRQFSATVITEYEVFTGSNSEQDVFWQKLFVSLVSLPLDEFAIKKAIDVSRDLRKRGMMIDIPDLFIGAIALVNEVPLATLNEKHFGRIEGLKLITPVNF